MSEMQRAAELLRQERERLQATDKNLSNLTRRVSTIRQGGSLQVHQEYIVPVVVESVDLDKQQFYGARVLAGEEEWEGDSDLPSILVDVPANMAMPPVNALVQVQYLGTYRSEGGDFEEPVYVLVGTASEHVMFIVRQVLEDYIVCEHYPTETTVYVLKPYLLQRSHIDLQTVNGIYYEYTDNEVRKAMSGGTEETQRVTPAYEEGNPIFGVPIDSGVSGITEVIRPNGTPLVWMDSNIDARVWAADVPVVGLQGGEYRYRWHAQPNINNEGGYWHVFELADGYVWTAPDDTGRSLTMFGASEHCVLNSDIDAALASALSSAKNLSPEDWYAWTTVADGGEIEVEYTAGGYTMTINSPISEGVKVDKAGVGGRRTKEIEVRPLVYAQNGQNVQVRCVITDEGGAVLADTVLSGTGRGEEVKADMQSVTYLHTSAGSIGDPPAMEYGTISRRVWYQGMFTWAYWWGEFRQSYAWSKNFKGLSPNYRENLTVTFEVVS
jgi:hypothetical protein